MIMLMKIKENIIQSDHTFQIIHTKYCGSFGGSGGSGSGKANTQLNLINNQVGIDKIYLYAKFHLKQNRNIQLTRVKK